MEELRLISTLLTTFHHTLEGSLNELGTRMRGLRDFALLVVKDFILFLALFITCW